MPSSGSNAPRASAEGPDPEKEGLASALLGTLCVGVGLVVAAVASFYQDQKVVIRPGFSVEGLLMVVGLLAICAGVFFWVHGCKTAGRSVASVFLIVGLAAAAGGVTLAQRTRSSREEAERTRIQYPHLGTRPPMPIVERLLLGGTMAFGLQAGIGIVFVIRGADRR